MSIETAFNLSKPQVNKKSAQKRRAHMKVVKRTGAKNAKKKVKCQNAKSIQMKYTKNYKEINMKVQ